jgi:hypothetical protein
VVFRRRSPRPSTPRKSGKEGGAFTRCIIISKSMSLSSS